MKKSFELFWLTSKGKFEKIEVMKSAPRPPITLETIRNALLLVLVSIIGIAAILIYLSEQEFIKAQTARIGNDRELVAYAGSQRMDDFFTRVWIDLKVLSRAEQAVGLSEEQTRKLFEEAVQRYEGTPLLSLVRAEKDGSVSISVNRENVPIGLMNAVDREYFIWAQEQKDNSDVYLSGPIIAKAGPATGKNIVVIAVPVFREGEFDGIVFASIRLRHMLEKYVYSISTYLESTSLLLDDDGTVLIGSLPDGKDVIGVRMGENQKKEVSRFPFGKQGDVLGSQIVRDDLPTILNGENGWMLMNGSLLSLSEEEEYIAGYAPIDFGNKMWRLVSIASYDEVFNEFNSFKQITTLAFVTTIIGVIFVGLLSLFALRRAQLTWYTKGLEISGVEYKDKNKPRVILKVKE